MLVTFGDGARGYRLSAKRLAAQGLETGMFDRTLALDASYLVANHPDFWSQHRTFILGNRKGFGYWLWKPFIISRFLKELGPGWNLAYLDGGSVLNSNARSIQRLEAYKRSALDLGIWATELVSRDGEDLRNETWCKGDTRLLLGSTQTIDQHIQVQAGLLLMRPNPSVTQCVEQWFDAATADNYHHLDDSPSISRNSSSFIQHRHDQAIFSILFRQYGFVAEPDETWFPNDWDHQGKDFPIWARRWTYQTALRPGLQIDPILIFERIRRIGIRKLLKLLRIKTGEVLRRRQSDT